jgi:hypothetical protein
MRRRKTRRDGIPQPLDLRVVHQIGHERRSHDAARAQ